MHRKPMTLKQARATGHTDGFIIVKKNVAELRGMPLEDVIETLREIREDEVGGREVQYLAGQINASRDSDATWNAYDAGYIAGVKAAIKKFKLG